MNPTAGRVSIDTDSGISEPLLAEHMIQVHRLARRYGRRMTGSTELADLVGAGTIGLLEARNRFSLAFGVKFSTYAGYRIRGAILDLLRSQGPIMRPREQEDGTDREEERSGEYSETRAGDRPALSTDPYASLLEAESGEALATAIDFLPRSERLVILLYYFDRRRMREIGRILDLDRSRISQLHASALSRLRRRLSRLVAHTCDAWIVRT